MKINKISRRSQARVSLWELVARRYAIPTPRKVKWRGLDTQIYTSIFSYRFSVVILVISSKCAKMRACAGQFSDHVLVPGSDLSSDIYSFPFIPWLQKLGFLNSGLFFEKLIWIVAVTRGDTCVTAVTGPVTRPVTKIHESWFLSCKWRSAVVYRLQLGGIDISKDHATHQHSR